MLDLHGTENCFYFVIAFEFILIEMASEHNFMVVGVYQRVL